MPTGQTLKSSMANLDSKRGRSPQALQARAWQNHNAPALTIEHDPNIGVIPTNPDSQYETHQVDKVRDWNQESAAGGQLQVQIIDAETSSQENNIESMTPKIKSANPRDKKRSRILNVLETSEHDLDTVDRQYIQEAQLYSESPAKPISLTAQYALNQKHDCEVDIAADLQMEPLPQNTTDGVDDTVPSTPKNTQVSIENRNMSPILTGATIPIRSRIHPDCDTVPTDRVKNSLELGSTALKCTKQIFRDDHEEKFIYDTQGIEQQSTSESSIEQNDEPNGVQITQTAGDTTNLQKMKPVAEVVQCKEEVKPSDTVNNNSLTQGAKKFEKESNEIAVPQPYEVDMDRLHEGSQPAHISTLLQASSEMDGCDRGNALSKSIELPLNDQDNDDHWTVKDSAPTVSQFQAKQLNETMCNDKTKDQINQLKTTPLGKVQRVKFIDEVWDVKTPRQQCAIPEDQMENDVKRTYIHYTPPASNRKVSLSGKVRKQYSSVPNSPGVNLYNKLSSPSTGIPKAAQPRSHTLQFTPEKDTKIAMQDQLRSSLDGSGSNIKRSGCTNDNLSAIMDEMEGWQSQLGQLGRRRSRQSDMLGSAKMQQEQVWEVQIQPPQQRIPKPSTPCKTPKQAEVRASYPTEISALERTNVYASPDMSFKQPNRISEPSNIPGPSPKAKAPTFTPTKHSREFNGQRADVPGLCSPGSQLPKPKISYPQTSFENVTSLSKANCLKDQEDQLDSEVLKAHVNDGCTSVEDAYQQQIMAASCSDDRLVGRCDRLWKQVCQLQKQLRWYQEYSECLETELEVHKDNIDRLVILNLEKQLQYKCTLGSKQYAQSAQPWQVAQTEAQPVEQKSAAQSVSVLDSMYTSDNDSSGKYQ